MKKVIVVKEKKVNKCDKCDKYGRLEKLNDPSNLHSGVYLPFCDCEFGQWMKTSQETGDMFYQGRIGK